MSNLNGKNSVLREVLQNSKIEPRGEVWDRIESSLTKKKKKSRVLILFMGTALILSSIVLSFLDDATTPDEKNLNQQSIPHRTPENTILENIYAIEQTKDSMIPEVKKQPTVITQNKKTEPIESNSNIRNPKTKKTKLDQPKPKNENPKDSIPKKSKVKKLNPKKKRPKLKKRKQQSSFFRDGRWSVSPKISFDTYHSFHEDIGTIITPNYGLFLNYSSDRHLVRLGYRRTRYEFTQRFPNHFERQFLEYQEVPVELKYFLSDNKGFRPAIFWGVSFLSLKEATLSEELETGSFTSDNQDRFSRFNITGSLGVGLETRLNDDFSFHIETQFKYHVNTLQTIRNAATYSFSASVGIEYKF